MIYSQNEFAINQIHEAKQRI